MTKFQSQFIVVIAALAMALWSCNSSDFAGGGSKNSGSTKDTSKGADANDDAAESGNSGSDTDSDSDGDVDGSEAGEAEGIDAADSEDGEDTDAVSDGDDITKKTRSDLKIKQTREDDKHQIKVELLIKGKVSKTEEVSSPGAGKEVLLKDMCRIGIDTCVRVTFIGSITQVAGGAACVFTTPISATSVKIDVDVNGAGFLGNCAPGEDEVLEFSCDEAKSLSVQGCNG